MTAIPLEDVLFAARGDLVEGSKTEVAIHGWGYDLSFGTDPDPEICSYMARVILWNGIRSAVEPLFANPSSDCTSHPARLRGTDFRLPGYGEDEEHWVEGTVWVDGERAGTGEVDVEIGVRRRDGEPPVTVTTDDEGAYRIELDGPQWFAACHSGVTAWANGGQVSLQAHAEIGALPMERCGQGRRLHDLRLGQQLAASGRIRLDGDPVGEDEAWVRLLDPVDSALVGDTAWAYDDGSYRLFFPHDISSRVGGPGCSWFLEAAAVDGASVVRSWQASMPCQETEHHDFELTSG